MFSNNSEDILAAYSAETKLFKSRDCQGKGGRTQPSGLNRTFYKADYEIEFSRKIFISANLFIDEHEQVAVEIDFTETFCSGNRNSQRTSFEPRVM